MEKISGIDRRVIRAAMQADGFTGIIHPAGPDEYGWYFFVNEDGDFPAVLVDIDEDFGDLYYFETPEELEAAAATDDRCKIALATVRSGSREGMDLFTWLRELLPSAALVDVPNAAAELVSEWLDDRRRLIAAGEVGFPDPAEWDAFEQECVRDAVAHLNHAKQEEKP